MLVVTLGSEGESPRMRPRLGEIGTIYPRIYTVITVYVGIGCFGEVD